jgi:hypothetical protein
MGSAAIGISGVVGAVRIVTRPIAPNEASPAARAPLAFADCHSSVHIRFGNTVRHGKITFRRVADTPLPSPE